MADQAIIVIDRTENIVTIPAETPENVQVLYNGGNVSENSMLALENANNPSGTNPFVTTEDITDFATKTELSSDSGNLIINAGYF